MSTIFIKEFSAPPISRSEILRYMGCRQANQQTEALIARALKICEGVLTYKLCFAEYEVKF